MTVDSLLPRNATPLERALEQSTARVGDVPAPLRELWNPATCPIELLPWLAWALSADRWEVHWSEEQKRNAVALAIEYQRKKGTPAAVEAVLASFDELLSLTEWFEMAPRGEPHTFWVDLPLISANGDLGGFRSSAEFAEAIIRDVIRTKPARSHFILRQTLESAASIRVIGAGRAAGYRRGDYAADTDIEPEWATYLTTENGEPLMSEGGAFLEGSTIGLDTAPDAFTFADVVGVTPGAQQIASFTPAGFNMPTAISIEGGEYQLDSGAWTAEPGTINPGQLVAIRHTASPVGGTDTITTLTIGGLSGTFKSTTADGESIYSVGDRIYVSNVSVNGIPVGDDTAGDGSRANPYLTIDKGYAVATAGKVILLNGDPAVPADYRAATIITSTKAVTFDSVVPYGAKISATTTSSRVMLWNLSGGATGALGKVIIDARRLNTVCLELSSAPAATQHVICNGTKFIDFLNYGTSSTTGADVRGQITLNGCVWTNSGTCRGANHHTRLIAGGFAMNGGTVTLSNTTHSTVGSIATVNAGAAGVTCSVAGVTATLATDATFSGAYAVGIWVTNIDGAIVSGNTVSLARATGPAKLLIVQPTADALALQTGNFVIEDNDFFVDANGGGTIWCGYDGTGAGSELLYADGKMNGGVVRRNIVQASDAAKAGTLHAIFNSCLANTLVERNHVKNAGIGLVEKGGDGAIWRSNIVEQCASSYMLAKGTANATFLHNTIVFDTVNNGGGMDIQANPTSGANSSNVTWRGNLFVNKGTNSPNMVNIEAAQTYAAAFNNYWVSDGNMSHADFYVDGAYLADFASYAADVEPTALNLDPLFTNLAAGDYSLQAGSAARLQVPADGESGRDYAGAAFDIPAAVGAFA